MRWRDARRLALAAVVAALGAPVVRAQDVADLDAVPRSLTLAVGERREVLATAYDARRNTILEVDFTWSSADPSVVQVEEDPSIAGVAYVIGAMGGSTTVTVSVGSRSREIAVTVSTSAGPVGTGQATVIEVDPPQVYLLPSEDLRLQVRFLKDDGSLAAPVPVSWRSYGEVVATVTSDGRVTGVSPGNTLVEANAHGLPPRRITIQVQPGEWHFQSPVISLSPTRSDTIRVVVPVQSSRPVNPRFLSWRSSNLNVAAVSPLGVATGVATGEARITAVGFGQQLSIPVRVHRPVDVLDVRPANVDTVVVPLGGTVQFGATALAADNSPIAEAPIMWTVRDTSVLNIDASTLRATGRKIGTTRLSVATPDPAIPTKTWTTVVAATGLVLDVAQRGVALGEHLRIRAYFADSRGNRLSQAPQVAWSSSNPDVVAVDAQGTAVPVGFGTAQIVAATPWGSADTATIYAQGRLLLTSTRSGGYDLYTVDPRAPTRLHPVVTGPGRKVSGVYSPDGARIAYATDRDGNFEIYVANADGSDATRLTRTAAAEGSPTWTLDGSRIYYESDAGGAPNVWSMNPDGTDQTQLTQTPAPGVHNAQPAISPDGRTVAFASTRDGNYDIYLMNADGSNQRTFTASPDHESLPVWIGDTAIAFLRDTGQGRSVSGAVVRMNLQHQAVELSPTGLSVTDFALSRNAEMLAVVVSTPSSAGGLARRMYLIPLGSAGDPREVPRASESDHLMTPAFRP
jgi:uncharacterized protein YjdB